MDRLEKAQHDAAVGAMRNERFVESLKVIIEEMVKELPYDYDILYVTDRDMHIDIDMQVRPKSEDQKDSFPYDDENDCFSATCELCFDWPFENVEIYFDDGLPVKGRTVDPVGIIKLNDLVSFVCGLDLNGDKAGEITSIFKEMLMRTVTDRQ